MPISCLELFPGGSAAAGPERERGVRFKAADYGLWEVHLQTWEGFVFVNLAERPSGLLDQLQEEPDGPLNFARYHIGDLRRVHQLIYDVRANWKIIHENYNGCLHCPGVHPDLVKLVPIFSKGLVEESECGWSQTLADGVTSFTMNGWSCLPPLSGLTEEDRHSYYGLTSAPNLLVNLNSDAVVTYLLLPVAPDRTLIITDFLFEPAVISKDGFDPSAVVEFWDLVSRQDWAVCERAQPGVQSRAFTPWRLSARGTTGL